MSMCSPVRLRPRLRLAVALGLALTVLVGESLVPPAEAAPRMNWPDLSKHQNKVRMLELIGDQFGRRVSRRSRYHADDLDRDLEKFVQRGTSTPLAPKIDDETFLRRITLDLTGRTPTAAQIAAFEADASPEKRSKKIDELLESDQWARKWARYWRTVIFHDAPGQRNQTNPQALEDWLAEQFAAGRGWDLIVGELVSASPQRNKDAKNNKNVWNQDTGHNNFVLSSNRDAENLASRTARLFMGISIECAECHDHPFDNWKREQFHELAAFFSGGRYYMPDEADPKKKHRMDPRFLLGEKPPENLKADQRRVVLAAYLVYNPENYWFARSYVNRVWSELVGDGFYAVDSLGPDKDVVHKLLVNKIAAEFRGQEFDSRWLFRLICNSDAYQREVRPIASQSDLFTAASPTRLRPWEIADRLASLGAGQGNIRRDVQNTFEQNPSVPHKQLEGTVQQALLMMNSGAVAGSLAKGPLLKRLRGIKDDEKLIEEAFLAILSRRPTDLERRRYSRLFGSGDRNAAIDDLVWVLMNSAEFLTKT